MTMKRFVIKHERTIKDTYKYVTENGYVFSYKSDAEEVCNLLNELHEENQDLKSFNKDLAENLSVCANARISKDNRIKRLEEKIQRERTSFTKTHERWSKEAETKIKELSERNERLKEYNNKLMKQPLLFDVQTIPNTMEIMEANNQLEKENEQLKHKINDLLYQIEYVGKNNKPCDGCECFLEDIGCKWKFY